MILHEAVYLGEQFSIFCEENASTGYLCEAKMEPDQARMLEKKYHMPTEERSEVRFGSPTKVEFVCVALKEGVFEIQITKGRRFEPGKEQVVMVVNVSSSVAPEPGKKATQSQKM